MLSPFALALAPDEDPAVGRILRGFFVPATPRSRHAAVVDLAEARRVRATQPR